MAAAPPDKLLASLACCRPDAQPQGDRRLRDALQRMESDPALKDAFARQAEFDGRMAALVRGLPLPETFETEVNAGLRGARQSAPASAWRGALRQPIAWAAILAGAFLVAYGAYAVYQHLIGFSGDETVRQLIEGSRTGPHADRLEPLNTECSQLGDKLFVQYGLEDYMVPAAFAHDQTLSYRVFVKNDSLVAQVQVRDHGQNMTFLVFRADRQGVNIHPPGHWKFLDGDGWTAAAEVRHHIGFVAIAPGDGTNLRDDLEKAEAKMQKEKGQTSDDPDSTK